MAQDDYTFGDSDLAERRLELLGTTFQDTTRDFLRAQALAEPALAVDLGCGPGHTTVLLRDTLHPKQTLAVDWKGETAPAVATGDGVKEPLNRRSTISINF